MSSRMLKELKALAPWQWDSRVTKHPAGKKALADFERIDSLVHAEPGDKRTRSAAAEGAGNKDAHTSATPAVEVRRRSVADVPGTAKGSPVSHKQRAASADRALHRPRKLPVAESPAPSACHHQRPHNSTATHITPAVAAPNLLMPASGSRAASEARQPQLPKRQLQLSSLEDDVAAVLAGWSSANKVSKHATGENQPHKTPLESPILAEQLGMTPDTQSTRLPGQDDKTQDAPPSTTSKHGRPTPASATPFTKVFKSTDSTTLSGSKIKKLTPGRLLLSNTSNTGAASSPSDSDRPQDHMDTDGAANANAEAGTDQQPTKHTDSDDGAAAQQPPVPCSHMPVCTSDVASDCQAKRLPLGVPQQTSQAQHHGALGSQQQEAAKQPLKKLLKLKLRAAGNMPYSAATTTAPEATPATVSQTPEQAAVPLAAADKGQQDHVPDTGPACSKEQSTNSSDQVAERPTKHNSSATAASDVCLTGDATDAIQNASAATAAGAAAIVKVADNAGRTTYGLRPKRIAAAALLLPPAKERKAGDQMHDDSSMPAHRQRHGGASQNKAGQLQPATTATQLAGTAARGDATALGHVKATLATDANSNGVPGSLNLSSNAVVANGKPRTVSWPQSSKPASATANRSDNSKATVVGQDSAQPKNATSAKAAATTTAALRAPAVAEHDEIATRGSEPAKPKQASQSSAGVVATGAGKAAPKVPAPGSPEFNHIVKAVASLCQASSLPPTSANVRAAAQMVQLARAASNGTSTTEQSELPVVDLVVKMPAMDFDHYEQEWNQMLDPNLVTMFRQLQNDTHALKNFHGFQQRMATDPRIPPPVVPPAATLFGGTSFSTAEHAAAERPAPGNASAASLRTLQLPFGQGPSKVRSAAEQNYAQGQQASAQAVSGPSIQSEPAADNVRTIVHQPDTCIGVAGLVLEPASDQLITPAAQWIVPTGDAAITPPALPAVPAQLTADVQGQLAQEHAAETAAALPAVTPTMLQTLVTNPCGAAETAVSATATAAVPWLPPQAATCDTPVVTAATGRLALPEAADPQVDMMEIDTNIDGASVTDGANVSAVPANIAPHKDSMALANEPSVQPDVAEMLDTNSAAAAASLLPDVQRISQQEDPDASAKQDATVTAVPSITPAAAAAVEETGQGPSFQPIQAVPASVHAETTPAEAAVLSADLQPEAAPAGPATNQADAAAVHEAAAARWASANRPASAGARLTVSTTIPAASDKSAALSNRAVITAASPRTQSRMRPNSAPATLAASPFARQLEQLTCSAAPAAQAPASPFFQFAQQLPHPSPQVQLQMPRLLLQPESSFPGFPSQDQLQTDSNNDVSTPTITKPVATNAIRGPRTLAAQAALNAALAAGAQIPLASLNTATAATATGPQLPATASIRALAATAATPNAAAAATVPWHAGSTQHHIADATAPATAVESEIHHTAAKPMPYNMQVANALPRTEVVSNALQASDSLAMTLGSNHPGPVAKQLATAKPTAQTYQPYSNATMGTNASAPVSNPTTAARVPSAQVQHGTAAWPPHLLASMNVPPAALFNRAAAAYLQQRWSHGNPTALLDGSRPSHGAARSSLGHTATHPASGSLAGYNQAHVGQPGTAAFAVQQHIGVQPAQQAAPQGIRMSAGPLQPGFPYTSAPAVMHMPMSAGGMYGQHNIMQFVPGSMNLAGQPNRRWMPYNEPQRMPATGTSESQGSNAGDMHGDQHSEGSPTDAGQPAILPAPSVLAPLQANTANNQNNPAGSDKWQVIAAAAAGLKRAADNAVGDSLAHVHKQAVTVIPTGAAALHQADQENVPCDYGVAGLDAGDGPKASDAATTSSGAQEVHRNLHWKKIRLM